MDNVQKMIAFYGSQEVWAQAWGVTPAAVSQWVAAGEIPTRRLLDSVALISESFTAEIVDGVIVLVSKERDDNNE